MSSPRSNKTLRSTVSQESRLLWRDRCKYISSTHVVLSRKPIKRAGTYQNSCTCHFLTCQERLHDCWLSSYVKKCETCLPTVHPQHPAKRTFITVSHFQTHWLRETALPTRVMLQSRQLRSRDTKCVSTSSEMGLERKIQFFHFHFIAISNCF